MEGIGRGTTLGGRYVVEAPLAQGMGAGRWSAIDEDLGRGITVLVLPRGDHRGAAVLDAARMAAGIAQSTLVRILDIGQDEQFVYVVEESLHGAPALTDLVRDGGLPGDEVRRITGEVATGLETASQRGVHHLELTPDDVFRTADGDIKVQGLGTSAALHSRADAGETAARVDAIAIVALAYAGLTGLAPEPALAGHLPPAPRVGEGVPVPSELAAGVPRDLDRLCELTLVEHEGPLTPGDYARQVAPWSTRQVNHDHAGGHVRPASVAPSGSPTASGIPNAAATTGLATAGAATVGAGTAGAAAGAAATLTQPGAVGSTLGDTHPRGIGSEGLAGVGAAQGVTPGAASAGAASPSAAADGIPGSGGIPGAGGIPESVDDADDEHDDDRHPRRVGLEPPAPLVPAEPLDRNESKLALAIVAAFVVLALVVGLYGISRIGSHTDLGLGGSTASTPKPSATPSAPASAGPSDAAAPQKLQILSADGFDPEGDGTENSNQAPRVFDGNPATAWTTEGYNTAALGGLKTGVGLLIDLGPNRTARTIDVDLLAQCDLAVYVSPDRSLSGATLVGEQKGANGHVTFPVAEGVSGQYIIVWLTSVARDSDGYYRGKVGEVVVYG